MLSEILRLVVVIDKTETQEKGIYITHIEYGGSRAPGRHSRAGHSRGPNTQVANFAAWQWWPRLY